MTSRDAQVHHQLTHRLGAHGPTEVGVDLQLVTRHALSENRVLQELLGQLGVLVRRHEPTRHVAAEDIDYNVEVVEETPCGTVQFGYVPTPNLVRRRGQQLRSLLGRVGSLTPAVLRGLIGPKDAQRSEEHTSELQSR